MTQLDNDELHAIADAAEARFAASDGDGLLEWVAEEFGYRTAVAVDVSRSALPL